MIDFILFLLLSGTFSLILMTDTISNGLLIFFLGFTLFFLYKSARFKLNNYMLAFFTPWLIIYLFSFVELSFLHQPIASKTHTIILIFIFSMILGFILSKIINFKKEYNYIYEYKGSIIEAFFVIFIVLTLLNIMIAGFIPLVSAILTGESNYMNFGLKGLYGFYLAFSNALGIVLLFYYFKFKKKRYLIYYFTIFAVFLLFVTRANIISLSVESFIVYYTVKKEIPFIKVFVLSIIALTAFSVIGNIRTSNIEQVAEIKPEYRSLPTAVYWLYSYSFINILNLDNLVVDTNAPYFDGSMFSNLIPSIFRPKYQHETFLEKVNFTVSSSVSNIYKDTGVYGLIIFGFIISFISNVFYKKSITEKNMLNVTIYSVLFFCSFGSFFVNYWFYLPVVFQIPVLILLDKMAIRKITPVKLQ